MLEREQVIRPRVIRVSVCPMCPLCVPAPPHREVSLP